jgi:predicted permease
MFGTTGQTPTWGARLRRFLLRNPPLWGLVAGLLVPKAWAPHVLVTASHVVVDATLVLGFLAVGVFLSAERAEDHVPMLELPDRRVWLAIVLRFCVNPGLLGLAALAGLQVPTAFVLQAAMPSGVTGLIIGYAYGLDQRLIASIIVWSTLIAVGVITIIYVV